MRRHVRNIVLITRWRTSRADVSFSNVDPIAEMVDMIAASKSYEANVEVFNTSKSLLRKTLTLAE